MEREDFPFGREIFAPTRFWTCLGGHVISIHGSNMYHYVNKVEIKSSTEDANKLGDRSEISNIFINVTEEHLNNIQKQLLAQAVDNFKASCLQSFSFMG